MEFTGERFIPHRAPGREIEIEHVQRYTAVLPLVEGCTVLDAATGSGYGASAMAERATSVLGIDLSAEAIAHARATYQAPNLRFEVASIAELPCPDASVDRVVSFETIEHVDEALQERFLEELDRVLRPDGLLIISTPDRRIYSERTGYANPFHVKEFDEPEFLAFLRRRFEHVTMFYQRFEVASTLYDGRSSGMRVLNPAPERASGRYMVAVCSRQLFAAPESLASVVLDDGDQHHALIQRILTLQDEHERLQAHIRTLDGELAAMRRSLPWRLAAPARKLLASWRARL